MSRVGGKRLWEAAGRPVLPSLAQGETVTPILHRSQIAEVLDLPVEEEGEADALARDAAGILDAWVSHLDGVPFSLLLEPTPSRGRSLRNLTVNVFHPFELLPRAAVSRRFEWEPERDEEREAELGDAKAVVAYAVRIGQGWRRFLDTGVAVHGDAELTSARGSITWTNLLAQQRWHSAFHYRQLLAFLDSAGGSIEHPFHLEGLGLDLPSAIF